MNDRVVNYKANSAGRDFIVGDIHGHHELLLKGLARVGFDKSVDRLFSVGDLVDRGPASLECLSLVLEPWFHAVRGNHEAMMEEVLFNDQGPELWLNNGGDWITAVARDEVEALARQALPRMPYAMEIATSHVRIGVVHAEPPGNWAMLREDPNLDLKPLLWARQRIANRDRSLVQNIDRVYVGHTPVDAPRTLGNVRYIDTGAFASGVLTIERIA